MKLDPNKQVQITVTQSKCDVMKEGDRVFLKGPLIDYENSAPVCITALLGIYPWVMTSRYGIESKHMEWDDGYRVWCPEGLVELHVKARQGGEAVKE